MNTVRFACLLIMALLSSACAASQPPALTQPTPLQPSPASAHTTPSALPSQAVPAKAGTVKAATAGALPTEAAPSPTSAPSILTFTLAAAPGELLPGFLEGYWIQNTSADGLCSDSPRLLGYDPSRQTGVFGAAGGQVCTLDIVPFQQAAGCYDGCFGFPRWWTSTIDQISPVNSVSYFYGEEMGCFARPAAAGQGGRCTFNKDWEWECRDPADNTPFQSILAYAIDGSDVEWFLSAELLASNGLRPKDRRYNLPRLVEDYAGVSGAAGVSLAVSPRPGGAVWVGTTAGLLKIIPGQAGAIWLGSQSSLLAGRINTVQAQSDDCVLAAAPDGIAFWNGETCQNFSPENGLPGSQVLSVSFDAPRACASFWALTEKGPRRYSADSGAWQTFAGLPQQINWRQAQYGEFTTAGQGAWKFIAGPVVYGEYHRFEPPVGRLAALARSPGGVVAAGAQGAAEWDGSAWRRIFSSPASGAAGGLIGAADGLWAFAGGAWKPVSTTAVTAVTEGGWFAAAGQVCRWAEGGVNCPPAGGDSPLSGAVALGADPQSGQVAVIDDQDRAWSFDPAGNQFSAGLELCFTPKTTALLPRPWGWALGSPRGLYTARQPQENAPFDALFPQIGLSKEWAVNVRAIAVEPQTGMLWLATNQGVFYTAEAGLAEAYDRPWTHLAGLPERAFTAVLPLADGSAWLGAESGAVILWRPPR